MDRLCNMYHPITGTPFQCDETYREWQPCHALRPYIRCFWGTERPVENADTSMESGIVIPDTCMDVIIDVNYTRNACTSIFCGIDETSALTSRQKCADKTATFGIRFYAWTAVMFADGDMRGSQNARWNSEAFSKDIKDALMPYMFDAQTIWEKICMAEHVMMKRLRADKTDADVLNAVYRMLETKGREKVRALSEYTGISGRHMERKFEKAMGVSPKTFSSLIRYQLLWQEVAAGGKFSVLDAVEKYGYTDQAHLLHDFKKRHLMTPAEAVFFAKEHR